MTILTTVVVVLVLLVLITLAMVVRIVRQYERGVLFWFGRLIGTREPGLRFIIPFVDFLHLVSMRIVTMPIQSQGNITQDNVRLDVTTAEWGVEVTLVELKDVQLPESMKRAMGRQAEAEREERAKIISTEGECLAAAALGNAFDTMKTHPLALQLRNPQSLIVIGVDENTTVVFPAPLMSTIGDLGAFLAREAAAATASPAPKPVSAFDPGQTSRRSGTGRGGRNQAFCVGASTVHPRHAAPPAAGPDRSRSRPTARSPSADVGRRRGDAATVDSSRI